MSRVLTEFVIGLSQLDVQSAMHSGNCWGNESIEKHKNPQRQLPIISIKPFTPQMGRHHGLVQFIWECEIFPGLNLLHYQYPEKVKKWSLRTIYLILIKFIAKIDSAIKRHLTIYVERFCSCDGCSECTVTGEGYPLPYCYLLRVHCRVWNLNTVNQGYQTVVHVVNLAYTVRRASLNDELKRDSAILNSHLSRYAL